MRFGINVPNFGSYSHPGHFAELAQQAELGGWDGLFVWDHMFLWDGAVVGDPWIQLAAAATVTETIKLGTMVTPLPRRRPHKVAREAASLQQLSEGRFILGVGIGTPPEEEFGAFGEETDARIRADKLDEGLTILQGMWSGELFSHKGSHYQVPAAKYRPIPEPPIPIWVAGTWPHRRPMRRALRCNGVFPIARNADGEGVPIEPDDLQALLEYLESEGEPPAGFEVAVAQELGDQRAATRLVEEYRQAGATWFQLGLPMGGPDDVFRRWLQEGPPR